MSGSASSSSDRPTDCGRSRAQHEVHGEGEQQDARTEERPGKTEPAEQESGQAFAEYRAELVAGSPDPEQRSALGSPRPVREQCDVVRPARRLGEAMDAHGHAHPQEHACDIRVDEPPEHDVARSGDAHAPGEHAAAFKVPAEPGREELAQHVGDEIDGPRPGNLDVVEAELFLQGMLDDRVDLAGQIETGVGKPGRREELRAIAAQLLGVIHVHVNDRPARSRCPSASSVQNRGGRAR
jgi:hypothetical protein